MGSELSAAGGRGSEVSEWPRSKLGASAVRQCRNFGRRNRIIGPYGIVCRGGVQPVFVLTITILITKSPIQVGDFYFRN